MPHRSGMVTTRSVAPERIKRDGCINLGHDLGAAPDGCVMISFEQRCGCDRISFQSRARSTARQRRNNDCSEHREYGEDTYSLEQGEPALPAPIGTWSCW